MKRVLLLLPTTGYRNDDFLAAAKKLGVEIVAVADYCHQLAPSWGLPPIMALHFDQPEQAADTVLREIDGSPDAVLAVDDSGVELAALLAERLGLPAIPPTRCAGCATSWRSADCSRNGNSCVPNSITCRPAQTSASLFPSLKFPVVVKARRLSGSRGVIRVDDSEALVRAVNRVRAIQSRADRDAQELGLIIEDFIPGREYALEGILDTRGAHHPCPVRQARSPGRAVFRGNHLRHAVPVAGATSRNESIGKWSGSVAWPGSRRAGPRRSAGQ